MTFTFQVPFTWVFSVPFTWVFSSRFEATRRIRQMESQANEQMNGESMVEGGTARKGQWHIPILAMTADVIHATHDECLKCGMDGYVSKPFEEENLYQAVARFFDSKSTLKS
jgi:histidine kinase 2/3/4 (cytokinin receptor)